MEEKRTKVGDIFGGGRRMFRLKSNQQQPGERLDEDLIESFERMKKKDVKEMGKIK